MFFMIFQMMLLKGLVLLVCLFGTTLANSHYENDLIDDVDTVQGELQPRPRRLSETQVKVCGERLFSLITMVCSGRRKRQALLEPRDLYTSVYSPNVEDGRFFSEGSQWTFQPAHDRFQKVGMLRNMKKRNVGITERCCHQSCTLAQMREYC